MVPAIRFEGFDEEWVEKELGEIAPLRGGFAFSSVQFKKSGVPIIKISNILPNGDVGGKFDFYEEIMTDHNYLLPDGAALLAMSGATTGKVAILNSFGEKNYQNQRVGYFTDKGIVDYCFVKTIVRSKVFTNKLHQKLVAGAQPNISSRDIDAFDFLIPHQGTEQTKIGDYFQQLDALIAGHRGKRDKLLQIKKSLLEKIFPKQGKNTPEIRFAGFDGDWVEKTLSAMAPNISDGDWIEADHIYSHGAYRIIQTGNLGLGDYIDKKENAKFFHQKDFDEIRANEIFPGDLLISRLAEPAGRTIVLPETGHRMVTAVDVTIIRSNITFSSFFLMQQMNTDQVLKQVSESVSGTSHKRISRSNLEKIKLAVPEKIDEQTKIGQLFKHTDTLINQHQTQITKLLNIKQACLAKMFV